MKVGTPVTMKVATKASLRSKKTENLPSRVIFLKQKYKSATKKIRGNVIKLA